jgi:hypothetical protein
MRTVRWGRPSEVAGYEFGPGGGTRYTEQQLRDLVASGKVRGEGGADGSPLRVGYAWIDEDGRSYYDLDWAPEAPTRVAPADDDPRQWPIEPPPPGRESGGGGNTDLAGRP